MKTVKTYEAKIYVGLKKGYDELVSETTAKERIQKTKEICSAYCDDIGMAVTFTPTHFIYTNGNEHGVIVGLINYPRFPRKPNEIKEYAVELAAMLMVRMNQYRVSVVCTDETIMLENEELIDE